MSGIDIISYKLGQKSTGGGSGGGAVSWNDLTDKPFGEELSKKIVMDNQTFEFDTSGLESGEYPAYYEDIIAPSPISIIEGWVSADVTFDGVTYENVPCEMYDENMCIIGGYDMSVYPFSIDMALFIDGLELYIQTNNRGESHTISIIVHFEVIHHIDPKYIKDMYGSDLTEVVSGSIANIVWDVDTWKGATSAEYSDSIYEWLNNMIPKAAPDGAGNEGYGESYEAMSLTINGKTRWLTDDYASMYASANWNNGYDAGAFFQIEQFWGSAIELFEGKLNCHQVNKRCAELFGLNSPDEVTDIEFTIYTGTFNRIDEKYIPTTIARVGDAPVVTSPSGKKFKLTVDDNGAVSAVEVTE